MRAPACGGCDRMHLTVERQADLHREEMLTLLGGVLGDVPELVVHTPSAPLGYRSRARLYVESDGSRARVGYRGRRSHRLVAVDACLVLRDDLALVLADLPSVCATSRGRGDAAVALGAHALPVVELRWDAELDAGAFAAVHALVESKRWAGARLWSEGVSEPASFGDPRARVLGADGEPLWIGGGFAQPSDEGGAALGRRAAELCRGHEHVVELFAGSGTLTVAAARGVARYVAVEADAAAAAALRENLQTRAIAARVVVADADTFALPRDADLVLLDPPRIGAAGVVRAIAATRPVEVVYLSCWPASLGRDLAVLAAAGYRAAGVELFELFPQTRHVETLVHLAAGG
jgi:23S rRNA (uracil1939-C5)-methyltransferase